MKQRALVLLLCVFVLLPFLCSAGDKGSIVVKPDPVVSGQYRVYDSKGRLKQTLKSDPVIPGQYRIEDRNGKPAGMIRPDPLIPGGYRGIAATSPKK
jgi:hypothetical protein